MNRILSIVLFFVFTANLSAQNDKINQGVLKKIELDSFNNNLGLEMGLAIVNLAKERHQNIAVQIDRLNHPIFLFVDDNLSADKHNWLRRKANLTKRFQESSLSVKNDLTNGKMTLEKRLLLMKKNI